MKKALLISLLALPGLLLAPGLASADGHHGHAGKLYLQTESAGEIWYVNPYTEKRYQISSPFNALQAMQWLGLGITNTNLEKVPEFGSSDHGDMNFTKSVAGKILIQVESRGEAWYVNPNDMKRYYLGKPDEAFELMKKAAVGISNADLEMIEQEQTIVDIAVNADSFNTLVAAVQAAGLDKILAEGGPFTVFAPTDDAFAKLPEGTVESLLNDIDQLTAILTYHVASGKVPASRVVTLSEVPTLNGKSAQVTVDGDVMIDQAKVVTTDIMAVNGIIHVIDEVILP